MRKKMRLSGLLILLFIISCTLTFKGDIQTLFSEQDNPNRDLTTRGPIHNLSPSLEDNISSPYLVSGASGSASDPQCVIDGDDNLHVVWSDLIDGNSDVLYSNYSYSKQKWGPIVNISSSSSEDEFPVISIDSNNNIWILWAEESTGPAYSLKGRYYDGQAKNWESTTTLDPPSGDRILNPDIASFSDGNMTVVYQKISGFYYNIFYMNYDGTAETWGDARQITYGNQDRDPAIYVDDADNAHLVYKRGTGSPVVYQSIMYTNYTWDSFETDYVFAKDGTLNVTLGLYGDTIDVDKPDVISSSSENQIYIAWENEWYSANDQIQLINLTLTDHINTSILNDTVTNITKDAINDNRRPKLSFAMESNNPMIVWHTSDGTGEIMTKRYFNEAPEQFSDADFTDIAYTYGKDFAADSNHSAYLVLSGKKDGSGKQQIWLQIYDVWHPQMQILSPSDDLLHAQDRDGNISFIVTTEPDTESVKYEYWNDTNHDGNPDLGDADGEWGLIYWKNSSTNQFNYEWNTTDPVRRSYDDIIIKITATDKHGLNTTKYITGVQIDNHGPATVELVSIKDTMGNFIENTIGDKAYFGQTVNFTFEVQDELNQVDTVELWNGTSLLASNSSSGNNVNITIDTESLGWNGNYTELYIKATDNLGNVNVSSIFKRTVVIDNTPPEINWVSLEEFMQYPQDDIDIVINTTLNDTDSVAFYYYNLTAPSDMEFIGYASYDNGNWTLNWDISKIDNQSIVKAQVIDKTGWETNDTIQISIDHTPPTVEILSPEQYETVGYRIWVQVLTEKDVTQIELHNSSIIGSGYVLANTSTQVIYENSTNKIFSVGFLTFGLTPNQWHYLKVRAFDSIRWGVFSQPRQIKISDKHPNIITIISGSWTEDETTDTFNVTINWNKPGFSENITSYIICRFLADYTRSSIDSDFADRINKLSDLEKIEFLGDQPGENYCVKVFNSSDGVVKLPEDVGAQYEWTETGVYAANYFYLVFAVNEVDLVSNCSEAQFIKITPQQPEAKDPDLRFVEMMPYLFIAYVAVLVFMSYLFVKSSRRRRFQRDTKDLLVEMDEEKFTDEGEKTLEDRLDSMEVMAEMSVKEDLGISAPKIIKSKADLDTEDAFLDMKIGEEADEDLEELASGPRRCPHCNWMISSSATKCPRCGKQV